MTLRRGRDQGLVSELQGSHRFTVVVLLSVLVLSLVTSGYLLLVSQPRVAGYVEITRHARDAHDGMLDQETGLRAWLATGDGQFLEPYRSGRQHAAAAVDDLLVEIRDSPEVTPGVLRMLLARQRWQQWATEAARTRLTVTERTDGTLAGILREGKQRFDAYRVQEGASIDQIRALRTAALQRQTAALEIALASYLLLLSAAGVATARRRRRLQTTIMAPITDLHETITALRNGDLSVRVGATEVPELAEVGTALAGLSDDLTAAGQEAKARERRLAKLAYRFETVVRVGREIAGSLSVRYVSASVTTAAAELLSTSTTLWLRGDNGDFRAVHRSTDPHGTTPPADLQPPTLVARAAAEALPLSEGGTRAYPLVLAGMVTAVLEVATSTVDPDTEQVLQALLSTAAASLESAHLHSSARELADLDGLTHLPNRRRFEIDADAEWERCRRYGRPLSLVMMDLDHFKRLNDEHGHLLGDEVLRRVADAVTTTLRTTDTAYRYGGEELVVLLRETGLEDATDAAERIRAAIAALGFPDNPQVAVSASAGVASRVASMTHYTALVAEADGALYEAKRQGRDRVVAARGAEVTLLFSGDAADATL